MATIRTRNGKYQAQVRRTRLPTFVLCVPSVESRSGWARQTEVRTDRQAIPADSSVLKQILLTQLVEKYGDEITRQGSA